MADAQFSFETDVLPVVKLWATKRFAGHHEKEQRILDALSVAWEIWRTAPNDATPSTIARYAVLSSAAERHISKTSKSADSKGRMRRTGATRDCQFDINHVGGDQNNPSRIVAFRIDFSQWLASLKERDRRVAEMLARGDTTSEVAAELGCTAGNVSQLKARLAANWYAYMA